MKQSILRVIVGTSCTLAIGSLSDPAALAARPTVHRHRISETQLIAMVGYTGQLGAPNYRRISGGTIDGTVGARSIHGALRAVSKYPTREIVDTVHDRRPPVIPASAGLRP